MLWLCYLLRCLPAVCLPRPSHPSCPFVSPAVQLDAASAMELDDMAQLDKLTNELLGARALGPPPAGAMLGGPSGTWPAAQMLAPGMPQTYSINSTPSSSDTLTAAQPRAPYLTAPLMQPSVAAPAYNAQLLGGTPFSGGLQPPPPLPGMRMPGAGPPVASPASGRSTGTGEVGRVVDVGGAVWAQLQARALATCDVPSGCFHCPANRNAVPTC